MTWPALDRWWVRAVVGAAMLNAVLIVAMVLVDLYGSSTDERIAITFLVNLILVMGLQTFVGTSGIISFAHIGFMAVGAYTAALLSADPLSKAQSIPDAPGFVQNAELGFVAATAIAVMVTMVIALLVGPAIVRLTGAAAAVATVGLLVITHTVLSNTETLTGGAKAFYGIPPHTTLGLALALGAGSIIVARLLRESSLGLGLRSSREDELAAHASGVAVVRARLVMWVASAGLTAVAGSLYAHYVLAILPSAFYFGFTFVIVTMVIVGGQSVTGAFVGAAALSLLTEFLRRAETGGLSLGPVTLEDAPGLTTIVLGLLIIGTMILRPKGLMGRWELDDWLLGRYRRAVAAPVNESRRDAPPTGAAKADEGDFDGDNAARSTGKPTQDPSG